MPFTHEWVVVEAPKKEDVLNNEEQHVFLPGVPMN